MPKQPVTVLRKFVVSMLILAAGLVVVVLMVGKSASEHPKEQESRGMTPQVVDPDAIPAGAKVESDEGSPSGVPEAAPGVSAEPLPSYHDSDEVIEPYKLSKNPYKWRGHSGILEMRMPVIASNGMFMSFVPLAGLKFKKMISEHTAIYGVIVTNEDSGDELAVILPKSDPPDVGRPWRVFVDGPMEATSGLGTSLTLSSLHFEGYYEAPKPEPKPTPEVADPQNLPN